MRKVKAALFWSGGKDSAFALWNIMQNNNDVEIVMLVTTINSEFRRISMHGVRESLLDAQAEAIGLPLHKMWAGNEPTNKAYENTLNETLAEIKSTGINHLIFGDIFLEDLKTYRDNILAKHNLSGIYPLWKKDTRTLLNDFLSLGFKTITCCVSSKFLDQSWVGKVIDQDFITQLPENVDVCGENGEFHTFCFDGPIFKKAVHFDTGEKQFRPLLINQTEQTETVGFWYIDLIN